MLSKSDRIFVAGHSGLVGSALLRILREKKYTNVLIRTHQELDLTNQVAVDSFFDAEKPDVVILLAAKTGGIGANIAHPAAFITDNLLIQTNVIHGAYKAGVRRLLFPGSACIYPKLAPIPVKESSLLAGALEPSNAPYAIAKIAGITLCNAYNHEYGTRYVSIMPTNLYGPGDSFDLEQSHVIPGVMHRMHLAKMRNEQSVTLWGTGKAYREFLYVDDLAGACLHLLENHIDTDLVNISSGQDITIADLATIIAGVVGYDRRIEFDTSKPDGTPHRKLDTSKMQSYGWVPKVTLEEGLKRTYDWFLAHPPVR